MRPVRQLEAEPEMERWQLEERKLQAALETLDCTERCLDGHQLKCTK